MEKPKLKILYSNIKKRIGVDRLKVEEYHVTFKFDTPEQREQFKEDVKAWYKGGCCADAKKENTKKVYDPETGNIDEMLEIEFYKTALKKAGIKFHPSTGLEKLKEKYDKLSADIQ